MLLPLPSRTNDLSLDKMCWVSVNEMNSVSLTLSNISITSSLNRWKKTSLFRSVLPSFHLSYSSLYFKTATTACDNDLNTGQDLLNLF